MLWAITQMPLHPPYVVSLKFSLFYYAWLYVSKGKFALGGVTLSISPFPLTSFIWRYCCAFCLVIASSHQRALHWCYCCACCLFIWRLLFRLFYPPWFPLAVFALKKKGKFAIRSVPFNCVKSSRSFFFRPLVFAGYHSVLLMDALIAYKMSLGELWKISFGSPFIVF